MIKGRNKIYIEFLQKLKFINIIKFQNIIISYKNKNNFKSGEILRIVNVRNYKLQVGWGFYLYHLKLIIYGI